MAVTAIGQLQTAVFSLQQQVATLQQQIDQLNNGTVAAAFLRLSGGPQVLAVDLGQAYVTFSGSQTSASATVTHRLGRVPTAIVATCTASTPPFIVSVITQTATNFELEAYDASGVATGPIGIYWLAIG